MKSISDFKQEMYRGVPGFKRGTRVAVDGRIGTVTTRVIGSGTVRQTVKFDEPDTKGKYLGSFVHTDLTKVFIPNDKPSEIDLLGRKIRRI